jgi:hypothetical protein
MTRHILYATQALIDAIILIDLYVAFRDEALREEM